MRPLHRDRGSTSTKLTSISGRNWRWILRARGEVAGVGETREFRHLGRGFRFEATEMMPRPPSAISGIVMASSPDSTMKRSGNTVDDVGHLADVARGFLHADDVVDLGQAHQRGGLDIDAGAALHAVDARSEVLMASAIAL